MIYRVAIQGYDGNYVFKITSSPAFWTINPGWAPIPGTLAGSGWNDTDPGANLYLDCWRLNQPAESSQFREFGILNSSYVNDTLLINTSYNAGNLWEAWLAVDAGNLAVVTMNVWTREGRGTQLTVRTILGQQPVTINGSIGASNPYQVALPFITNLASIPDSAKKVTARKRKRSV